MRGARPSTWAVMRKVNSVVVGACRNSLLLASNVLSEIGGKLSA